ncbi:MAG: 2-oxoglutarate dehydrogenase, E2 component, dihydrolipoamide succinyltransferase [Jatrophihabitantaceae bacterium]
MSVSVTMPRLGESVTEGTVTRWLKQEGEHVDADEPLLEVSTDKVDTEIPSPASGTVLSIKVQEDETVDIGVELAVIGEADEAASGGEADEAAPGGEADEAASDGGALANAGEPAPEPAPTTQPEPAPEPAAAPAPAPAPVAQAVPAPVAQAAPAPIPVAPVQAAVQPAAAPVSADAAGDDDDVAGTYVTPLVRKLATEHGIDLASIQGTGIGGRIRKSDVLAAAQDSGSAAPAQVTAPATTATSAPAHAAPTAAPTAAVPSASAAPAPAAATANAQRGRVEPMSRMRQVIATRMVESLQTSAQLTTVVEVDVTKIARLRTAAKDDFEAREGVKLSFLPFFAVAAIEALKAHPVVNASVDMDAKTISYHDSEHLGIAVDTDRGLLVPVIHDAGDLNLAGIARKIADLAERTRTNKISPDELGGGTFTLTNTGSRGALFDTPIINQPQVGILGTGAVVKRAVVVSDDDLGETIAVRSMIYLALSYDHRIVDGADAARFLATMKLRLEAGAFERALGMK